MKRTLVLAIAGAIAATVAACSETLDGGSGCPALCPQQTLPVQDIVLDAVAFDTTLGPFPILGTEPGLLLASRGDTLDVRAVVRWDSLPNTYIKDTTTHPITDIDSVRLFVRFDTSTVHLTGQFTLEAYDVDTTAADSNTAAVAALFRPDRFIASVVVERATLFLDDTLSIPVPKSYVLGKITSGKRMRVGLRVVGNGDVTLLSVESGLPVSLRFDPAPGDTTVGNRSLGPLSRSPTDNLIAANDLLDYSIIVKAPPRPTERIAAGGLPSYRSYLRFVIPKFYLDSVVIVRAQLSLTQLPIRGFAENDSVTVYPVAVSTTGVVTDLTKISQLTYPITSFQIAPLKFAQKDSGQRTIDIVQLVRQWSAASAATSPLQTAMVLRVATEGRSAARLGFFGLNAPAGLRPTLKLSFVARSRFGMP